MRIRKFRAGDAKEVSSLVALVFTKSFRKDFSKAGAIKYLMIQSPENITKRAKTRDILIGIENETIIAMIEGNGKDEINSLYVDPKFQKQGVATKLLTKIEKKYQLRTHRMKVLASPTGVEFYKKRGYKKSTRLISGSMGFVYQPMRKVFKKTFKI